MRTRTRYRFDPSGEWLTSLKRGLNHTDLHPMGRAFGGLVLTTGLVISACASETLETTSSPSTAIESGLAFAGDTEAIIIEDSVFWNRETVRRERFALDDEPARHRSDWLFYRVRLPEGVRVEIAVPDTWTHDDGGRFTDGTSSVQLAIDCDGECGRDWKTHFGFDTEYLDFSNMEDHWVSEPLEGREPDVLGFGSRALVSYLTAGQSDSLGNMVARTAHFRDGASHFVGCEAALAGAATELGTPEREICRSVVVDWSSLLDNQSDPTVDPGILTSEMRALVKVVEPTASGQLLTLDDDGGLGVAIDLLPGAEIQSSDFTSAFSAEIRFPEQAEGFFTRAELSTSCGTFCEPQDWVRVLNVPGGALHDARLELASIDNDSRIASGWILSGPTERSISDYLVVVATFDDSARRYLTCRATLDEEDLGFLDELVEMCLSATPNWFEESPR